MSISGRWGGSDSLHLVVMDAHRDPNQLARGLATESIAGALVYGIDDGDRVLVRAFAGGVARTQRCLTRLAATYGPCISARDPAPASRSA